MRESRVGIIRLLLAQTSIAFMMNGPSVASAEGQEPAVRAATEADTLYVCYVPDVGAIYIIRQPRTSLTECLPGHEQITWLRGSMADTLGDGSVSTRKLANSSVTDLKLADGSVATLKIADSAVTSAKVRAGAIGTPQLADGAVTTGKLAGGSVTDTKLADGAVSGIKVAAGAIGASQLADTAIAGRHLSQMGAVAGQALTWTGSTWAPQAGAASQESDPTWIGTADSVSTVARIGSVNIGTTSTGSAGKLHVVTEPGSVGIRITNSNSVPALRIVNDPGAGSPLSVDNAGGTGIQLRNTGSANEAVSIDNSGTGHGLRINNSGGTRALYVVNSNGGYAGWFAGSSADVVVEGNLDVGGTLTKGGGSFEIDHPLDPENMILRHSFVESPDMMNVYNGIVVTDSLGFAVVELPAYFEALNSDFRYQLSVIGQFAQAIVTEEVDNNRFTICTNRPHVKVSWQVTGIRRDSWAERHRIVVEEAKRDSGSYLHPSVFVPTGSRVPAPLSSDRAR